MFAPPPGIETFDATDRAKWLALRERDVTASVAGALLGVHEYQTPYALWALKSGVVSSDAEETGPMLRGRLLEPVALQLLAEQRPTWRVSAPGLYYRDAAARMGATPDSFAVDPERAGFGVIQVKTVEPSIFRRKWKPEDFGEVECPLWIAVQAVVEAELTGASWVCVVAMTVGFGVDLHVIDVPLHRPLMQRLRDEVREFWRRVEEKDAPDPDYGRDAALIAGMYRQDSGTSIDLSGDNMLPGMADEDERLAAEIKERETRRKELKTELLVKMGDAAVALVDGRVAATAKTVNRKEYTAKASSYRDVRFKRSA